jgi:enolase
MGKRITKVHARQILDCRGFPTVEVDVFLEDGSLGRAAAPAGTSTGTHEALEKRDGDKAYFQGMGVKKAVVSVNREIAKKIVGEDALDQKKIDRMMIELDGTGNKSRLGGNAIVATSMATAKAAAQSLQIPLFRYLGDGKELPIPWIEVMEGGLHSGGTVDFQEFAYFTLSAQGTEDGLRMGSQVYFALMDILRREKGYEGKLTGYGGGFCPVLDSNEEALALMTRAIEVAGYQPGKDLSIYIDVASTHFYENGKYHLRSEKRSLSRQEMVDLFEKICTQYPVVALEDCMAEEDWEGWKMITERLGKDIELVGDDLFVTRPERIRKGIAMGVANSVLIKVNQIGTLTETIEAIQMAKAAGYTTVVSARSGETEDTTICHLVVAFDCGQCKLGGLRNTERVGKFNELFRIEEILGENAVYRGGKVLARFPGLYPGKT